MPLLRLGRALCITLLSGAALPAASASQAAAVPHGEAAALITSVRSDPNAVPIPALSAFTTGARSVPAGATEAGPVAIVDGTLDVYGTVTGDAIAVHGDVVLHEGGRVTGNAFAARGRVLLKGGIVDGEIRTLSGEIGPVSLAGRTTDRGPSTWRDLKLSLGWFAVLLAIGLGVLVTAGSYLDGVTSALESSYARSLLAGIAGQLSILPALLVIVVGLALTIIGIPVIPFAVVAFALALAGLLTLGFLAVAVVTGRSLARRPNAARPATDRRVALRALVVGISLYLLMWIAAAALGAWPTAAFALRVVAAAVTWVVVTAGFGATLISRGGTRRPVRATPDPVTQRDLRATPAALSAVPVWQTPTPVAGVVAARRPLPAQRDVE